MPANTRARSESLAAAAAAHVAAGGGFTRPECDAFAVAHSCTRETARRHIAHAANQSPRAEWGGRRDGAGAPSLAIRIVTLALTEPPTVALAWLNARRDESTPADIDQLIAALWSAANKEEM